MLWYASMEHKAGRGTRSYPHIVGVRCTDGPIGGSSLSLYVGDLSLGIPPPQLRGYP